LVLMPPVGVNPALALTSQVGKGRHIPAHRSIRYDSALSLLSQGLMPCAGKNARFW